MTLSDIEWQDAKGQTLPDNINYDQPFDLERTTTFGKVTHMGRGVLLWVRHAQTKGAVSSVPKIFGTPTDAQTYSDQVRHGGGACF